MNEELINKLKELKECSAAVNKIEEFISKKDRVLSSFCTEHQKRIYFSQVINSFNRLSRKIENDFGISHLICKSYLRLDKKLFSKFDKCNLTAFTECPRLIISHESLSGSNIEYVIKSNKSSIIDFFEPNVDLFPKSTRTFLLNKIKSFNMSKNDCLIDNDFKLKTLELKLADKANATFLKSYYNKICDVGNLVERTPILIRFYSLLHQKYNNQAQSKSYDKFFEELEKSMFMGFYNCVGYSFIPSSNNKHNLKKVLGANEVSLYGIIKQIIDLEHDFHREHIKFLFEPEGFYSINEDLFFKYFPNMKTAQNSFNNFLIIDK